MLKGLLISMEHAYRCGDIAYVERSPSKYRICLPFRDIAYVIRILLSMLNRVGKSHMSKSF